MILFLCLYSQNMVYMCAHCQPLVVGAIQYQQESPVWCVVKKETLFSQNSSVVIPNGYENSRAVKTARPPWARQLCSVPCLSAPLSSETSSMFHSARETQSSVEKEVDLEGSWLI